MSDILFYIIFILVILVEFEQSSYTINEKAGKIEVCLLSNGQNNADIFVFIQPQETVPVSARGIYSILSAYVEHQCI